MKDFKSLIDNITVLHNELQKQAVNAVNQSLTIRNWLIGFYIVEYEQNGNDRAAYGKKLLQNIEKHFEDSGIKNMNVRRFRDFRLFYSSYPQIRRSLIAESEDSKRRSLTAVLGNTIMGSLTSHLKSDEKREKIIPKFQNLNDRVSGKIILSKLSYTHLEQLISIKDDIKRTFYEIECIKGTWSVRELKRQISSLYYERSGLSAKPEKLSKITLLKTKPQNTTDIIKNIYAFEFLNINNREAIEESDLETALLDNLQAFITELGNGFCLEARQKRILIGDNYYFIDLVFYHRILKCHIIVELKVGAFSHGDIGQLNTYLNFFKSEISEENDNAPVGILLVADKDHALVKFATAGMDENLFVQQYLVQLPSKEQLEKYINNELSKLS